MIGIKTKVTCPKCHQTFDYEFIPGASVTAVRLGNYRYMKCQKCGKWTFFNVIKNASPEDKKVIGLSAMLFGSLLAVLGAIFIVQGMSNGRMIVWIVGIILVAAALFMIGSGAASIKSAKKK